MTLVYGNWSTNQTFILDTTPPFPPLVHAIPEYSTTSPIVVTGLGEPGCSLEIWLGTTAESLMASGIIVTVQPEGNWSVSAVPLQGEVTYIAAKQTDIVSNVSGMSNVQVTQIDLVAPSAEIIFAPVQVAYKLDDVIEITLVVSETLQSTPVLTLAPHGQSAIPITLTSLGNNAYSGTITILESYQDGVAVFSYTGTDMAGNIGTSITSGGSFVIDKAAPVFTLNAGTLVTNDDTRFFDGSVSDAVAGVGDVTISVNGAEPVICNIVGNTWSAPEITFVSGVNTVEVTATDNIGNSATVSAQIVKNVLPYAPHFTGIENIIATNNAQPTVVFVIPFDSDDALDLTDKVHFKLQTASDVDFTNNVVTYESRLNQAGWKVDCAVDGSGGVALSSDGTNLYGHYASYTFASSLTRQGDYYWRIAATDNVVG